MNNEHPLIYFSGLLQSLGWGFRAMAGKMATCAVHLVYLVQRTVEPNTWLLLIGQYGNDVLYLNTLL